ncbi:MAG: autotransporter-associated beta strand repeat-containing protein [Thermoguttaceae bacterium]
MDDCQSHVPTTTRRLISGSSLCTVLGALVVAGISNLGGEAVAVAANQDVSITSQADINAVTTWGESGTAGAAGLNREGRGSRGYDASNSRVSPPPAAQPGGNGLAGGDAGVAGTSGALTVDVTGTGAFDFKAFSIFGGAGGAGGAGGFGQEGGSGGRSFVDLEATVHPDGASGGLGGAGGSGTAGANGGAATFEFKNAASESTFSANTIFGGTGGYGGAGGAAGNGGVGGYAAPALSSWGAGISDQLAGNGGTGLDGGIGGAGQNGGNGGNAVLTLTAGTVNFGASTQFGGNGGNGGNGGTGGAGGAGGAGGSGAEVTLPDGVLSGNKCANGDGGNGGNGGNGGAGVNGGNAGNGSLTVTSGIVNFAGNVFFGGTAGTAGTGGTAGAKGLGGAAGTGGTGGTGNAGADGTAGTAGANGTAGTGPSGSVFAINGGVVNTSGAITFRGTGNSMTVGNGGTFNVNGNQTVTLGDGSFTFANGSTLGGSGKLTIAAATITGPGANDGITLNMSNGGAFLTTTGTSSLAIADFGTGNYRSGTTVTFATDTYTLNLGTSIADLTWKAGGNGVWEQGVGKGGANWTGADGNFMGGDTAIFTTAGAGNVTLTGDIAAAATKVDSGTYTFTGTGKLTSTGTLAVASGAALTLENSNDYSGGTTSAGTLTAKKNDSLGTGDVTNNTGGILNLTLAADGVVANKISGAGAVNVNGAGKVTLTAYSDAMGTLTVSNGGLQIGNGAASGEYAGEIAVASGKNVTFNRNNDLEHTAKISGAGSVTQAGSGTLTLSQANTYAGGTTVSAGTLKAGDVAAFGTGAVAVNAGTLDVNGNAIANAVTLAGGKLANNGAAATLAGNVAVTSASKVGGTGDLTLNGTVSGSGALTKEDANTLTLSGTNSGYSGATTISAGKVVATGASSLGTGAVTNNAALDFDFAAAGTVANAITGTGTIEKKGVGALTLSGTNNTAASATITGGTLNIASGGKLTTTGAVNVANGNTLGVVAGSTAAVTAGSITFNTGGKLDITGYAPNVTTPHDGPENIQTVVASTNVTGFDVANVTIAGQSTVDFLSAKAFKDAAGIKVQTDLTWNSTDPTRQAHGDFTVASGTFAMGATLGDNSASTNKKSGWDGKSLTKLGAGTLLLSGNNTYDSATTVSAGTLQIGHLNAMGTSAATVASGATLDVNGYAVANTIALSGSLVNNSTTATTLGNTVTLAAASKVGGTGNLSLGNIGGAFGLEKVGTGKVTLTGTNVATSTTVSAGTLALGAGGEAGGNVTIASGAKLSVDRTGTVANAIANAGAIDLTVSGADLQGAITGAGAINVNEDATMSGTMTGFNGTTTVAAGKTLTGEAGVGTLALVGTADYSLGGSNRSIGTLNGAATSTVTLGANDLSIANGGAFAGTIGGTGAVNLTGGDFVLADSARVTTTGATTVASGSTLTLTAAADSANATIQGGSLTIDAGGTLKTNFSSYTIASGGTVDVHLGSGLTGFTNNGSAVTVANRLYKVVGDVNFAGGDLYYTLKKNFGSDIFPNVSPSIGPVIDSYTGGNLFIENLLTVPLTDEQVEVLVQSSFDAVNQSQAAPSIVNSVAGVSNAIQTRLQAPVASQMGAYRGQCAPCASACGGVFRGCTEAWVSPIYGNNRGFGLRSGNFKYGFDNNQWGIGFGLDKTVSTLRYGVMGVVGGGRMVSNGQLAKTWNETTYGGVYVYANQRIAPSTDLMMTTGWVGQGNSMRQAQLGGDLTGSMDNGMYSISTRLTKTINLGTTNLMPHVGLDYGYYYQSRMNAVWNGATAFVNERADANMVVLPVGASANNCFVVNGAKVTPTMRAQYIANVADVGTGYNTFMTGSPTAALMATRMADRHAGSAGFGLGWTRGRMTLTGDYDFMFSQHYQTHLASFAAGYKF